VFGLQSDIVDRVRPLPTSQSCRRRDRTATLPVLKMQLAVRNETALFTGARIVYVGSLGQLPVRSGLASASAVVWLTPWAALDRLWLATDPPRCRGLIIAMAFPERRRRHPSGTVRVALPQRARSRPHPPPPSTRSGPSRLPRSRRPDDHHHGPPRSAVMFGGSCKGGRGGARSRRPDDRHHSCNRLGRHAAAGAAGAAAEAAGPQEAASRRPKHSIRASKVVPDMHTERHWRPSLRSRSCDHASGGHRVIRAKHGEPSGWLPLATQTWSRTGPRCQHLTLLEGRDD
jgi:hypothetical protein